MKNALIAGGTLGPVVMGVWGFIKYNPEKKWTRTYIFLSVLGIGWGAIQIYKQANDIKYGSVYHVMGYFISGIITGIVLTMALVHRDGKRNGKEGAPKGL